MRHAVLKAFMAAALAALPVTVVLGVPDRIVMPKLSFSKAKLPKVRKLDEMHEFARQQRERVDAVQAGIREMGRQMTQIPQWSYNDPPELLYEHQLQYYLGKVDIMLRAESQLGVLIEQGVDAVVTRYGGDGGFDSELLSRYEAALEEVAGLDPAYGQADGKGAQDRSKYYNKSYQEVRDAYDDIFQFGIRVGGEADLRKLREHLDMWRESTVDDLLTSVESGLRYPEGKKGHDLANFLYFAEGTLDVVARLDPSGGKIRAMRERIAAAIQDKRFRKELAKSLKTYGLKPRYGGGGAPTDAAAIEQRVKELLESSAGARREVRRVVIAGTWQHVRHLLTGQITHHRIDLYAAVRGAGDAGGELDILYVTATTLDPDKSTLANLSVVRVGRMLEQNL